ncbi:MAG: alpha-L-fucosidase [Victivallales bacterium]
MRISRTDWFHEAKFGVFMHFLAAPASSSQGAETDADAWNRRVDSFDVKGVTKQLLETRAKYFVLTLGQNSGHFCVPNKTYDQLTGIRPSKCARRDLVSELHDALAPHGIRLMVYLPAGAPEHEPMAVEKFGWTKGGRCAEFQQKWESVIREWSLRWGKKVSGWWFDGCYYNDEMYQHADEPNFKSFAAAARAGNPDSLVGWNPGVEYPPYTVDDNEDYTAGEVNEPQEVDAPGRWDKQAQFHILTYLGKSWGQLPIRFTAAEAIENTLAFTNYGGVVTWDVPLTFEGLINPEAFAILKEIGKAVGATRGRPDREPPKVVRPSIVFLKVPSFDGAEKSDGRLRVTLKNHWNERIRGEVELSVEPASFARIEGAKRIVYDLEPGAETKTEHVFTLGENASADTAARVVLTRSGDERKLSYRLPKRERVAVPRLTGLPSLTELADAMKAVPSRMIITEQGRGLADVKLAIADGHLAIFCRVGDQIMRQAPGIWDGSCLELFGIAEPGDQINQLFFIPATANLPSKALKLIPAEHHSKIKIVPAPELKFTSWPVAGGYTSAALIPLAWWLKRATPPDHFLFEIIVNTGVDMNSFGRAAMFGNINASIQSEGYAMASVI